MWLSIFGIKASYMHAISVPSKVYHLLYPTFDYTLCGFKAVKLDVPLSAKRVPLHIVSVVPANRLLCSQCAKMQERQEIKWSEASRGNALRQVSKG